MGLNQIFRSYAFRMVQENHVRMKLYGTFQLLVYADDVNLPGHNIT
jgi:hypothetical protein